MIELQTVKLRSYKIVYAWALEQDFNPDDLISSVFEMEWPPSSGKIVQFPEMDRTCWFPVSESKEKIIAGQPTRPKASLLQFHF
jgi:predicted NUDIX family NTP pyrophosphohydrolase